MTLAYLPLGSGQLAKLARRPKSIEHIIKRSRLDLFLVCVQECIGDGVSLIHNETRRPLVCAEKIYQGGGGGRF